MFFNVTETTELCDKISKLVGSVGRLVQNAEHKDVSIWCEEHGKVWYGDLTKSDISKLSELKIVLYLLPEWDKYTASNGNWKHSMILKVGA